MENTNTNTPTAIELAFNIDAKGRTKKENIDNLLDYILDIERNIINDKQGQYTSFYQNELQAAKNKLKEIC